MYDDLSFLKMGIVQFPKVVIARWYISLNYSLFSRCKTPFIEKLAIVWLPFIRSSINPLNYPISYMLHGAGIWIPTLARTKSPSYVGKYSIPAPWVAYGYSILQFFHKPLSSVEFTKVVCIELSLQRIPRFFFVGNSPLDPSTSARNLESHRDGWWFGMFFWLDMLGCKPPVAKYWGMAVRTGFPALGWW